MSTCPHTVLKNDTYTCKACGLDWGKVEASRVYNKPSKYLSDEELSDIFDKKANTPIEPAFCTCSPEQTCHICKDDKLASGISPKFDQGKLQYSLVPPIATKSLAEVLTFGAQKYAPNSWQGVEDGERRYTDALYRHLEAYRSGEKLDSDSNLSHLAHAITNIAFLLHFEQQKETT